MKVYIVQEIRNEASPNDCVGEMEVYTDQKKRDDRFMELALKANEYSVYYSTDTEIDKKVL